MKSLGYLLLVLGAPAFLESAFEMYVLTFLHGPQMLFFSISHTWGGLALSLLLLSWVCLAALAIYGGAVAGLRYLSKDKFKDAHGQLFTVIFSILAVHLAFLVSYELWS